MTTVAQLLERLASRLAEDSSPSDTNERDRRISFLNEAQRKVMGGTYWWFTATTGTFNTVASQEIYSLPDDFRDMIEVRIDGKICQPITQDRIYNNYDYPPLNYEYETLLDRYWIFGDNEMHILPVPESVKTVNYRYWQQHTDFTGTASTTIIPDRYTDVLVAYALGKKMSGPIEDERGSMSDAFEEYNEILKDMKKENLRKKFYFKQFIPRGYEDTLL